MTEAVPTYCISPSPAVVSTLIFPIRKQRLRALEEVAQDQDLVSASFMAACSTPCLACTSGKLVVACRGSRLRPGLAMLVVPALGFQIAGDCGVGGAIQGSLCTPSILGIKVSLIYMENNQSFK